uniref:BURP domain-containing protein n=1 Tax=Oryza brachyantha TaxID=4533 RepID=J3L460_ORYBR
MLGTSQTTDASMASSSSPARHIFLFALAFLAAAGAADAWPSWGGGGRVFFSKTTRPEAVELDKVAVATTAAAAADSTNSNSASDEFSRPSSGGDSSRGYGLSGRPEESYPEAYFRRGVHHDAEKLTTTDAAAATAAQEKEKEEAPAGVAGDGAWAGYPEDGSGRGRPLSYSYARMHGQQTTTSAATAAAEQEKEEEAAPAGVSGYGAGREYTEDGSGRGRPMSYAGMRGGQQQQPYDYGMSDTRLYQNGRYYYDVNSDKYGYGRESNPVRGRPEEFNGGRRYGGGDAAAQEYPNGNDHQEEFGVGYRAGVQVGGRRYGGGNAAGHEYAGGNDQEEFGTGYRAGVQAGKRHDNAAAGYDANGLENPKERYIP